MATVSERGVPVHLWLVGLLALLWNAYGCYDYLMTMTGDQAYLAQLPPEAMSYWESLPTWTTAAWALGVWAGLAGALLLLLRSRYAVWAFALSLIGAVLGIGYQMTMTDRPASMSEGAMAYIEWVVILVAVLQLWYAWSIRGKGWLR